MFYSYDLLNPRDGALSLIWQLGNLEDASKWRDVAKKSDVWNAKILDYCNEIAKRLPIQNPSRLAGPGDGGEVLRDHFSLRLTSILFSGLVQCHCLRMELILKEVRAFQLRHIRRPRLVPAIDLPKGKKGSKEAEITQLNLKDDASYFGQLDQKEQGPDEIDEQVLVPRFKAHEEAITLRELEIPRTQLNDDDDNNFGMGTGADFELENNPFVEEDLMVVRPPRKSTLVSPSLFLGDDLMINERDETDSPTLQLSPPPLPPPKSRSLDTSIVEPTTVNEPISAEELEPPLEKEPTASPSLSPLGDVAQAQKEPPKKKRRRKLAIDEKTTFDKETLTDNIKTFDQLQFSGNRFQLPRSKENLLEVMGRPMIQPHWTEKFLLCGRAPYVDVEEIHSLGEDEDNESIRSMENRRTRSSRDRNQDQELIQNSPKPRSELGVSNQGNFEMSIERDGTRNASSLIEQSRLSELKNSNLVHSLANDQPEPAIGENLPENDDFAFPSPPHLNTIVERTESLVADTSEANFPQLSPLPGPMSSQLSVGSSKTTFNPLELPNENEFLEKVEELQQERGKFVTFDMLVENLRSKRAVAKCFSLILVLSSKRLLVARQTQSFGSIQVRRA